MDPLKPLTNAEFRAEHGTVRDAAALEQEHERIGRYLNPAAVEIVRGQYVEQKLAGLKVDGVLVAKPEAAKNLADAWSDRHDAETADRLLVWDRDAAATEAHLQQVIAASRRAPQEPDPSRRDLRTLVLIRLLETRSYSHLADRYEGTPDTGLDADPVFTDLIERERDRLSEVFRLTPDPARDAQAIQRLQKAIETRQAAREDAAAKAELARVRALRSQLSMQTFIMLAQRGELRIARAPQGRGGA